MNTVSIAGLKQTEKVTTDAHQVSHWAVLSSCAALTTQTSRGRRESLRIWFSPLAVKCEAGMLNITEGQLLAQHQSETCCARDCSHAFWSFLCYLHHFTVQEMEISQEQCNHTLKARAGGWSNKEKFKLQEYVKTIPTIFEKIWQNLIHISY